MEAGDEEDTVLWDWGGDVCSWEQRDTGIKASRGKHTCYKKVSCSTQVCDYWTGRFTQYKQIFFFPFLVGRWTGVTWLSKSFLWNLLVSAAQVSLLSCTKAAPLVSGCGCGVEQGLPFQPPCVPEIIWEMWKFFFVLSSAVVCNRSQHIAVTKGSCHVDNWMQV